MSRRAWVGVIALLILLAVILAAPYLLLHQQEVVLLGRAQTQTVEQGEYHVERQSPSLLDRINLTVDPDAVPSWLAQEMVGDRFGRWEDLTNQLRRELQLLLNLSDSALLGKYNDLSVIYYYQPDSQQMAAFASYYFSSSDGTLTLEMDLWERKITAFDFWISNQEGQGVLQIMAAQFQSADWERRWANYLGLEYLENGKPEAVFRGKTTGGQVTYQQYADGENYSWRPVYTAP